MKYELLIDGRIIATALYINIIFDWLYTPSGGWEPQIDRLQALKELHTEGTVCIPFVAGNKQITYTVREDYE
jgi:hypothetical protein